MRASSRSSIVDGWRRRPRSSNAARSASVSPGDVGSVRAHRGEQLAVAAERQRDPVLDLEPGRLARRLDRVHHLAREALAAQRVVSSRFSATACVPERSTR